MTTDLTMLSLTRAALVLVPTQRNPCKPEGRPCSPTEEAAGGTQTDLCNFNDVVIAGSLESANSSILAACNLF